MAPKAKAKQAARRTRARPAIAQAVRRPQDMTFDEVQAAIETSGRCAGQFTDVARRLVATFRPEDFSDSPNMETLRWGLACAIGILRDDPALFDNLRADRGNEPDLAAQQTCPRCGESADGDGAIFDHPACRDGRCLRCSRPQQTPPPFAGQGHRLGE